MKHVLHFAEDGDTSGFFPQLAKWHDKTRYKMAFATLKTITPRLREAMESQGVKCFSFDATSRRQYPWVMIKLARLLRREKIDILHTHLFDPSVVGLQASVLARTPVRVCTRHYSDYHTRIDKKWHVQLDRFCTRLSHRVIAVSNHTADHLINVEHAPKHKIVTILNGIDFDRVKRSTATTRERIRSEFAAEGELLLVIIARLHPEKGHHFLFEAMPEIMRKVPKPVRLLVVGTGPFLDQYKTEVKTFDCDDRVSFLGFRQDSPDLIAAADLVILPSLAEAFGLALTESLFIGTPVVATKVGGIPEIIDDGVDGVLVPPSDSRALGDAIIGLLTDEQRLQRMTGAGREKVATRFRFDNMVRSYEQVYEGLLPKSASLARDELGQGLPSTR